MNSVDRLGFTAPQRSGNDSIYGNGVDGDVTIAANTTLTSDAYYNNLTVNANCLLNTNGFRVFVKNTLTLGGVIGVGSLSGGVVGEPASDVLGAATYSNQITYRLGGSAGGSTSTTSIPVIPEFLIKNINNIASGVFADPGGLVTAPAGFKAITGGAAGTVGSTGATTPALTDSDSWPGKAGGVAGTAGSATGSTGIANPDKDVVGVPGGKGNPSSPGTATGATPGPGGAGGTGGTGGPVVCVIAKNVVGSGKIVSLGRSGIAGSAGSFGNPGTQGANGAAAPNKSYHVAPTSHPNPSTFNPEHHNHTTRHSDFHGHATRQSHPNPDTFCCSHHVAPHHCCSSHDSKHGHHDPGSHHANPPAGGHHHHVAPTHTPHHHHNGHFHHPHNDTPHGGAHHWNPHWWHAKFQISEHYSFPHYHSKPNGHHSHYDPPGHAHHHQIYYHGNFWNGHSGYNVQGVNNNYPHGNDFGYYTHGAGHTPHHGGHSHATYSSPRYSHSHVAPTTHSNPDGHFTGGAGGVNDGITTGARAPAVQGATGKRGGAGGGGIILLVSDSVSGTITYDTRAGLTDSADAYSAANGATYVLINS